MRTKISCLAAFAAALCLAAYGQQPAQTPAPQQPAPANPAQPQAAPAQGQQPPASGQPAAGQQQPAPDQQGAEDTGQVFRVGVNEVNLIFTVTDKHGHYVPNLRQNDFALLDDQKAPEKVTSFRQQVNLPLRVGIVIDASTSIRTRFQFEQQSAIEFLLQILKAKSDRAFVMGFDVTPTSKPTGPTTSTRSKLALIAFAPAEAPRCTTLSTPHAKPSFSTRRVARSLCARP